MQINITTKDAVIILLAACVFFFAAAWLITSVGHWQFGLEKQLKEITAIAIAQKNQLELTQQVFDAYRPTFPGNFGKDMEKLGWKVNVAPQAQAGAQR